MNMKKVIKDLLCSSFIYFILFVLNFILVFCFTFVILYCVSKFVEFDFNFYLYLTIILSIVISIIAVILEITTNTILNNRLVLFLKSNFSGMFAVFLLIILIIFSVENFVYLTIEGAQTLLSLGWAIFGITVSTFVLWIVLAEKKLDNFERRQQTKSEDVIFRYEVCNKIKKEFAIIVYIAINLFSLCFATGSYIHALFKQQITILGQTIIISGMYFSTNTLIQILVNVLFPYILRKKNKYIKNICPKYEEVKKAYEEKDKKKSKTETFDKIKNDIDNK